MTEMQRIFLSKCDVYFKKTKLTLCWDLWQQTRPYQRLGWCANIHLDDLETVSRSTKQTHRQITIVQGKGETYYSLKCTVKKTGQRSSLILNNTILNVRFKGWENEWCLSWEKENQDISGHLQAIQPNIHLLWSPICAPNRNTRLVRHKPKACQISILAQAEDAPPLWCYCTSRISKKILFHWVTSQPWNVFSHSNTWINFTVPG